MSARPRSRGWGKRSFDLLASALMLLLLVPLLLVVAIVLKLDSPGPVFFRQRRLGRDLHPFDVLKIRTMHAGASEELHQRYIAELVAQETKGDSSELKKLTADPRVTRVGRFLRRFSIDEVPQLWNVLRGQMSLVGPRPALDYELEYYEGSHFDRFVVRPGITGLWQVSGRSSLGFREMLELDAEYARTADARTDMGILVRTPAAAFRHAA